MVYVIIQTNLQQLTQKKIVETLNVYIKRRFPK